MVLKHTSIYLFVCGGVFLQILHVFGIRSINVIETKYIEDLCSSDETKEVLLSTGTRAALMIKPFKESLTTDDSNCTILIDSSNDGVILRLESRANNDFFYEECGDYIQIASDKNATKLCGFKSSSFTSEGSLKFAYYREYADLPQWKFTILATAYRKGNGICSSNEFKCNSGECIWKEFRCDGVANCPDASDEFSPRNSICISVPHFTFKPFDFDWNIVFPTPKSVLEYRKSFNVTITAAVACAFLIFIFGVVRFVCHYHCSRQTMQRRRHTNLRTFSIIRPRPMFQPEYECPPPPSYVSLINDSPNTTASNPPAYSTVVLTREGDSSTDPDKNLKNSVVSGPPPPYEP